MNMSSTTGIVPVGAHAYDGARPPDDLARPHHLGPMPVTPDQHELRLGAELNSRTGENSNVAEATGR